MQWIEWLVKINIKKCKVRDCKFMSITLNLILIIIIDDKYKRINI